MSTSVDWSELPPELIEVIAKKLKIHKDYVCFRAVCSNWRRSTSKTPKHLPCQLPWLMLPQSSNQNRQSHLREFFSLSDDKIYRLSLPEASNIRRRCGSSHGWLVILEESPTVFLINPLTRVKHHLPPLSSFPNVTKFNFYDVGREYTLKTLAGDVYTCNLKEMRDSFIKKVVFSSSPSDEGSDYFALAILNQTGDLAYCEKGDSFWKFIGYAQSYCEDVVYHKGCFYAVSKDGTVAVCDVCGALPNISFIQTPLQVYGDMQYLVSLEDELLLVSRYLELGFDVDQLDQHQLDLFYKTTEFLVYKLVLSGPVWESVSKLDDWALFVGESSSMAFRASDFQGCKGNNVYFTDDHSEWNSDGSVAYDLGVYDLEGGSVAALPCYPRKFYNGRQLPPPIWITPSLH